MPFLSGSRVRFAAPEDRRSSPMSPSLSPRGVHFPSTTSLVTGYTRPLTSIEAWSLYHLEIHARACSRCFHQKDRRKLCGTGDALAQDAVLHVQRHRDGEIYATHHENGKLVRVEVPSSYEQVRTLLKALARLDRKSAIVEQHVGASQPVGHHRSSRPEREQVIVEPARSGDDRRGRHKSKHGHRPVEHRQEDRHYHETSRANERYRTDSVVPNSKRSDPETRRPHYESRRPTYVTKEVEPERRKRHHYHD